jgi:CheY-like chemotaxis protein
MSSILVLDDRGPDRELLATVLGHAGYSVREASTGDEALALVHAAAPDLVITDIVMPGMNGYEFVRRLRSHPDTAAIPVAFCTANYEKEEVRRLAASCGVSHFIAKPSDPETIVRTVGEVLGSPRTLPGPMVRDEFDREQLRLLNDKLVEKVDELESAHAERRKLVGQLINAHEEERKRWWRCGCGWRRSPPAPLNPSWRASSTGSGATRRRRPSASDASCSRSSRWSSTGEG